MIRNKNKLLEFNAIVEYCERINIPPPLSENFDIRRFEDNMATVVKTMPPFRHHFYAIALKLEGEGFASTGNHQTMEKGPCVFFNTPFQILSWDIKPNWKGYYLMFTEDFILRDRRFSSVLFDFPFLQMDRSIPFKVEEKNLLLMKEIYEKILKEHHSTSTDRLDFIHGYLQLLLYNVRRSYNQFIALNPQLNRKQRRLDVSLTSRFQSLVENAFSSRDQFDYTANSKGVKNPHSVKYYADQLALHPNHLNSIVKRVTQKPASKVIQSHVLMLSKSMLSQTELRVKEIAYRLFFKDPTHFISFFKKRIGVPPNKFREHNKVL